MDPGVPRVGPTSDGFLASTQQLIRPAGQSIEYHGRPVDLVLSPDHRFLYVKNAGDVTVVDAASWKIVQTLPYSPKGGASLHGIAIASDGTKLYVSTAPSYLHEATIASNGTIAWSRNIVLPGLTEKTDSYPCGVALSRDCRFGYVCLSMSNMLAIVDLAAAKVVQQIPVGIAPYGVAASTDDKTVYITNWGGRRPNANERTAKSADSDVLVDAHGIASSGTVGVVNLAERRQVAEIETGLHPCDLTLSADGKALFVANANSDSVSVIDTASRKVRQSISVRPDPSLPFCSAALALALSPDNQTLFVANGGNNAIAVVSLSSQQPALAGFVPTGWYPGALVTDGKSIYAANIKGVGSRDPKDEGKWKSTSYRGSITKVAYPKETELEQYTKQVLSDSLVPQALRAWEKGQAGAKAAPVPQHVGEPSTIDHVLYVIKENRTYDQVMGDMPKGNNDPKLCVYGRKVTPNQHALADQFVLLDNFYCNGVISTDGHAWATEGVAVDYLEKSMGAWSRSYPFWGNDPLAFAPTGFIWDNALLHGLTFRNYGEMSVSRTGPIKSTYVQVLHDYQAKTHKITREQICPIESLKKYSCPDSPGWNLHIPDVIRADVFLREFEECEKKNQFPNLVTLYLPSNHTSGVNPGAPKPTSMVADNDLAVGRVVEAVSKSPFWPSTCIFIIEDDPQAGFDHVDGHRSVCLVVSPYTRGRGVVSQFYNQTSVLHTMELMLGLPPMNQMDAMAPVMRECFNDQADARSFTPLPINYPLDEVNPEKAALSGDDLRFAARSERLNFSQPDLADEDTLNRILWHEAKGDNVPYPAELAGAHGKGLRALHLKLDRTIKDDDDD